MDNSSKERAEKLDAARLLKIHANDNVAVATRQLHAGEEILVAGETCKVAQDVGVGAKLAIKVIPAGEKIIKYGESIGSASTDILQGDYVHTHNLSSDYIANPDNRAAETGQ